MKENIINVVANSGCQDFFFPLFTTDYITGDLSETLWHSTENFAEWNNTIPDNVKQSLSQQLVNGSLPWEVVTGIPYIRHHLVRRQYNESASVIGVEISIETNQDSNGQGGYFWKTESIAENDPKQKLVDANGTLRQPPSPYNSVSPEQWVADKIPQAAANPDLGIIPSPDGGIKISLSKNEINAPIFEFYVIFKKLNAAPCNVDLIVDFGNSRTMALLLKEDRIKDDNGVGSIEKIRQNCVPVLLKLSDKKAVFQNDLRNVDNGVVSSWFVLHETKFPQETPLILQRKLNSEEVRCGFLNMGKKTLITSEDQRVPNMFVQISPVLLGDEADDVLHDAKVIEQLIKQGAMLQQSSPKRYFCDKNQTRKNWSMIPNYIADISGSLCTLKSDMLYWMDENGEFVDRERVPEEYKPQRAPEHPNYPRSASFVWMFVGILEKAWKQCNSYNTGTSTFEQYILKNIIVTFPAGWTNDELNRYRRLCNSAVEIFRKNHFGENVKIELNMDLDEAVASQIPYVFSEIHEFGDNAEGWMKFAGKNRNGTTSVRILNFDIGGGTSDISLIEYEDSDDTDYVELQPRLLYKNGYSSAGDEVLRRIIADIVLKGIAEKNTNASKTPDDLRQELEQMFSIASGDDAEDIKRASVVRQCLIPVALGIMNDLSRPGNAAAINLESLGITLAQWDDEFCNDFLKGLDGMPALSSLEISYSKDEVNAIIRDCFEDSFKILADLAVQYDVDLFFTSGKTSELPEVRKLALQYMPLSKERIVTAKNYRAGDWYPFANEAENTVKDAKSVTAVGAALYHILSSKNSLVDNWQIHPTEVAIDSKFEWGLLNMNDKFSLSNIFNFSGDIATVDRVNNGRIIAKRLSEDAQADAVYRFASKDNSHSNERYTIELQREINKELSTESLRLISVTDQSGNNVTDAFELTLWQYADEKAFWQDTGRIL